MANSFLTAQWVARKSLVLLHAKATAAARSNRNYQDEFRPIEGVPRGTTINVRLPFRYTLRTGSAMVAQNSVQRYSALTLNNQNGVDINFSSIERAMDLGDFEEQVLEPALAQVSAGIEGNITALVTQIPKQVGTSSTSVTFTNVITARRFLSEALAPEGDNRTLLVSPQHNAELVTSNAALYNPQVEIGDQWIEGIVASKVGGFMVVENTKIATYTTGTFGASTPIVSGSVTGNSGAGNAYASTMTLTMTGWASAGTTLTAGDVFTISAVYDVDPENKISLGRLKQFVVTTQVSDTTGTVVATVAPCAIYGGAYQNVSAQPLANAVVTVASASDVTLKQSFAFYRDAILFACVPMLDLSNTVKMCASESFDGFNLRFVQIYDADNDLLPGRIDTLSGEILAYPELAVRVVGLPA